MKRQLFGLLTVGLALGLFAGCVEDPTDSLSGDVEKVISSLSYVQINVGDSILVQARAVDAQGNSQPSLPTVTSGDETVAKVSVDETTSGKPFPETAFFIKAVGFGTAEITASGSGTSAAIDVQTWPGRVAITTGADTLRSGASDTYTAQALSTDGQPITGPTAVTYTWTTSAPAVGAINATTGSSIEMSAMASGVAVLSVTVDNGASTTKPVSVLPGLPVAASLSAASFGAVGSAATATLEVLVTDAMGNVNNLVSDLLSFTATSSDPGVAAVTTEVQDVTLPSGAVERHFLVTATGVGAGTANISGSVETASGTLPFTAAPVTVLAPVVTAAAPSGLPGETISIDGAGLAATGFATQVLVDGTPVGNVTAVTETQVTAQMPTLAAGTYDLQVSVGGVLSNADTWTQTADFDEAASEPNDAIGQEAPISSSFAFSGTSDEATDFDDLFEFTVTEDNLVIDLELSWGDANDLDALIYPKGAAAPGTYGADNCAYHLATLANPEHDACQLGAAGTYVLEIMHYGTGPTTYTIIGTIRQ